MEEDAIIARIAKIDEALVEAKLKLAKLREQLAEANARAPGEDIDRAMSRLFVTADRLSVLHAHKRWLYKLLP